MSNQGGIIRVGETSDQLPQKGGVVRANSQGEFANSSGATRVDIVEVIDTTGSMSSKIDGLLATSEKFVDKLAESNIDWQMAIVAFGDLTVPGDSIVATSFSRRVEVIKNSLKNIPRYSGGGNEGESSLEALNKALTLKGYRQAAIKVFVFLTDEPALQSPKSTGSPVYTPSLFKVSEVIADLRKKEVLTFVVSIDLPYYREMAKKTGGKWFPISSTTDFLSILDQLMTKVSQTIVEVETLGGGSVEEYLRLKG